MRWIVGLSAGLLVVVLVNMAFIWVAVQNQPEVEPSYLETPR